MKQYEATYYKGNALYSCFIPARTEQEARVKAKRKGMKLTGQWLVEEIPVTDKEMTNIINSLSLRN